MGNGASSYLRFLNGDYDAFVELVREYNDKLVLFLNTIVDDIHISEEAADETFLKLYTNRPVYNKKYGLKQQGLYNADVDGEAGVTANDARVLQEWDWLMLTVRIRKMLGTTSTI